MTRRAVACAAWLLTVAMTAVWVWVLAAGGFIDVDARERRRPRNGCGSHQGWLLVAYAALVGLGDRAVANATVGLLLAWRPGGGRMGAILLAGGRGLRGRAVRLRGRRHARHRTTRSIPVANALFLLRAGVVRVRVLADPADRCPDVPGRALPSPRWRWPSAIAIGALLVGRRPSSYQAREPS